MGGVDLRVRSGECVGVIGESGSGKSVTALSVMGLVPSPPGVITAGAAHFAGRDLIGATYETLRRLRGDRVAYIFQDPLTALHPLYAVGEQLVEAIRAHHPTPKAKAREQAIGLLKVRAHPECGGEVPTDTPTKCRAACGSESASPWRWQTTPN